MQTIKVIMNKNIKSLKQELFLSYDPSLIEFKKQAKILHKNLKDKGFSLMQAQEIIARNNGFNNWNHFYQLLKNQAQSLLGQSSLLVTSSINDKQTIKSYRKHESGPIIINESDVFLGYDKVFKQYYWANDAILRKHQLVIGQDIYKKYDLFIAKQAIEKGYPVIFFNDGCSQTLNTLIDFAISNGRQKDIKLISSEKNSNYSHYQVNLVQDLKLFSSGYLTELIFNCLKFEPRYQAHTDEFNVVQAVLKNLINEYEYSDKILTLQDIKNHLSLYEIIKLNLKYKNNILEKYLIDNTFEKHQAFFSCFFNNFDNLLQAIKKFTSLDKPNFPMSEALDKNKKNIWIIQGENQTNDFYTTYLLENFGKLIQHQLFSNLKNTTDSKTIFIFLRNKIFYHHSFFCLLIISRSYGISMNVSYPQLSYFKNMLTLYDSHAEGKEVCFSILANFSRKIISAQEGDHESQQYLKQVIKNYANYIGEPEHLIDNQDKNSFLSQEHNQYNWLTYNDGFHTQILFENF